MDLDQPDIWYKTVDLAAKIGANAIILANLALLIRFHEKPCSLLWVIDNHLIAITQSSQVLQPERPK